MTVHISGCLFRFSNLTEKQVPMSERIGRLPDLRSFSNYGGQSEDKFTVHIFWVVNYFLYIMCLNKNISHLIVLHFHVVPTTTVHLSYRVTSFSIPCWYQSVSCVISHRVTTVTTSRSSLNLSPLRFCFTAVNRWQSLSNKFLLYNHSHCRIFKYGIIRHVDLFCHRFCKIALGVVWRWITWRRSGVSRQHWMNFGKVN
jgi:hypothetical protein